METMNESSHDCSPLFSLFEISGTSFTHRSRVWSAIIGGESPQSCLPKYWFHAPCTSMQLQRGRIHLDAGRLPSYTPVHSRRL
jgi:hypothetical protein